MSENVAVALIAAGASIFCGISTLIGVIVTNSKSNKQYEKKLEIHQAVTDTKIDELTREVREHNNFAQRMPVLEEKLKVANHRIDDLEGYHKQKQ